MGWTALAVLELGEAPHGTAQDGVNLDNVHANPRPVFWRRMTKRGRVGEGAQSIRMSSDARVQCRPEAIENMGSGSGRKFSPRAAALARQDNLERVETRAPPPGSVSPATFLQTRPDQSRRVKVHDRQPSVTGLRGILKTITIAATSNEEKTGPERSPSARPSTTAYVDTMTLERQANDDNTRRPSRSTEEAAPSSSVPVRRATTAAQTSDVEDFIARAHALGLKLTKEDYQRARAGVSAFLRAKRVTQATTNGGAEEGGSEACGGAKLASADANVAASDPIAPKRVISASEVAVASSLSGSSSTVAKTGSLQPPPPPPKPFNLFSSLNFLTAVELVQEPQTKLRPRLDEISSLEERRRRRERRRRLRERADREANDADCETGSHRCRKAASESCLESPVTCIGAEDTPVLSASKISPCTENSQSRRKGKDKDTVAFSAGALARLGLGISECEDRIGEQSSSAEGLLEAWRQSSTLTSPGLSQLTRKARIDHTGRLTLMPSPTKEAELLMHESLQQVSLVQEDEEASALNAGVDTDDSGVCFTSCEANTAALKKGHDASPSRQPSHRRRLSSMESSNFGGSSGLPDHLSFLDRIMAQKKSPLRLRNEAKSRERQERLAAAVDNDLIVMTARTSIPVAPRPILSENPLGSSLIQPSVSIASNGGGSGNQSSTSAEGNKSVRWASDFSSDRKRVTTKEIYDFEFYGIAPSTAHNHVNAFPSWDAAEMDYASRRAANDPMEASSSHQRVRSNFNGISFGSPLATRTGGYDKTVPLSPGMLSLSLQQDPNGNGTGNNFGPLGSQLSAKRGLLFGAGNSGVQTPPVPSTASQLDNAMLDMNNVFSHGPTLAQSPARKGQIDTETPPRLVRSATLAAPIALAYQAFGRDDKIGNGSPERGSLVRAQSFPSIERRNAIGARGRSAREGEMGMHAFDDDKENRAPNSDAVHSSSGSSGLRRLPKGWAHRSPAGKVSATISPAALFGFPQQPPHPQPQQRSAPPRQKEQRARHSSNGSGRSTQYSASEAEGDDERDMSPITLMQGSKAANTMAAKRKKDASTSSRNHQRQSSASNSSAYDDSPLMLDTRSNKATIVVRPTSGNSLARALDMPSREGLPRSLSEGHNAKRKKKAEVSSASQQAATRNKAQDSVGQMGTAGNNTGMHQSLEWDKPDGSRIVKLVSEELQAAIESGALTIEPASRFYKLPPGWGRSKDKPQSASYAGMIGQAILSSSDGRLSLNEIYNWIATVFPFFERGDRGWQNSIRHNLSLNKSFIKVERDSSIPGKGGWWAIKSGHEDRFRNGSYVAPGAAKASKESSKQQQQQKSTGGKAGNDNDDGSAAGVLATAEPTSTQRRKRPNSDRSTIGDAGSDSDSLSTSGGHSEKKAKKVKQASAVNAFDGGSKPLPVTLLRPESATMSPKPFGMKTPNRADHLSRQQMGTNSSEFGSAYASSVMATLPLLTDASSPPSSPHNGMPPPAGGVRGAASSQSAQKQAQSGMSLHSFFGGSNGNPAYGYTLPGSYSQHGMPASPLANVRGSSYTLNSRSGVSLTGGVNPDSPLHRPNDRATMIVNSPPVSNVRDTDGEGKQNDVKQSSANERQTNLLSKSLGMATKSPARFLQHSPVRGSPLRPGGAQQGGMMLSPAGSHLQMLLGGGSQPSAGSSSQQSLSAGSMGTTSSYGATTPLTARWGYASPSPSRRLDGLFSPGQLQFANTPNGQSGHAISTTGLDDPFDYSGSLQHEFDMTNELHFNPQGDPSPMKGFEQHAFGHRGGTGTAPLGSSAAINSLATHFPHHSLNNDGQQYGF